MRGDLHTLKKVCTYASGVMYVAEFILPVIAVATVALGIVSLFSESVEDMFLAWISSDASDTAVHKVFATMKMTLIWVIGSITIKTIHDIMCDIRDEHSPFTEKNTKRMINVSLVFLVSAFVFLVFDIVLGTVIFQVLFVTLGCILISVVMYCLALMCRYGSLLQKESDETL